MRPQRAEVNADLMPLLPDADFADAFALAIDDRSLDAPAAARLALGRTPSWVTVLAAIRDLAVAPLGLKTRFDPKLAAANRIGIFPVISETASRVVVGFDDAHLDFRVAVDVADAGKVQRLVTVTTLVRRHGFAGRAYLTVILPFHRLVVPAMLAQVRLAA